MNTKSKRLHFIFIIYWFLLTYIIVALIWWFIALNRQNQQMTALELQQLDYHNPGFDKTNIKIKDGEKRKTMQYLGEGAIFFLLIVAGAVYVFRIARKQLKQSQEQQNFMMAITHELKTPIAITKLNLETLQKRKLDEPQQQRLIQNTLQEANRLNSLCNNLLLSSQMEAGGYIITFEETDLSQLVNDCINDFIIRFPQRIFHANITDGLFVRGDCLLLQMAINNLIDNAIRYSSKETKIEVVLTDTVQPRIQLQIKDEGIGIAEGEKQSIFNKFYRVGNTATKESKGTGIGLYLTKKIIRQHKGIILVKNNLPKGSIFIIEIKKMIS